MTGIELLRAYYTSDLLNFTKYQFLKIQGKRFMVNHHHKTMCRVLNRVYTGEIKRLIINVPPRYTKTELAVKNFMALGLGINPRSKFIHLSYSDDLVLDNSEQVRTLVKSEAYRELFPYVVVSSSTDSKKKWYTTAGGGIYATSIGAAITGMGAGDMYDEISEGIKELFDIKEQVNTFSGAIIIDDPIKPNDALSNKKREYVNKTFENTIRSRVNTIDTPIIVVMQRLHTEDLTGYLLGTDEEWHHLCMPAITEAGKPLWEYKHSLKDLLTIKNKDSYVFETQYMQNPLPIEGRMYESFRTYEALPSQPYTIRCVTDTADTGSDYLCAIIYAETKTACYVLDILYTDASMEYTEPELAKMICRYKVDQVLIESNNGGRSFARNVERICRENGNLTTRFRWFHQTKNKEVRIFTNAAQVQNMVYYPGNWATLFPVYYNDMKSYKKKGRNIRDDAPDATTMIVENKSKGGRKYGFA